MKTPAALFKGTLMQIWKSPYLFKFILKLITKQFLSYSPVKFSFFLKSRLIFNILYYFCMFVNKHFANFTGI